MGSLCFVFGVGSARSDCLPFPLLRFRWLRRLVLRLLAGGLGGGDEECSQWGWLNGGVVVGLLDDLVPMWIGDFRSRVADVIQRVEALVYISRETIISRVNVLDELPGDLHVIQVAALDVWFDVFELRSSADRSNWGLKDAAGLVRSRFEGCSDGVDGTRQPQSALAGFEGL